MQFPARHDEPQPADKLVAMLLADAQEVDDLLVEVIEHLDDGGGFVKEHLCAAGEWFDVRYVRGQHSGNGWSQTPFSADVWKRANHTATRSKLRRHSA